MAKKGRPTREPTAEERKQVVELVKEKTPVCDIAVVLGRSEPNLRKYFSAELFSEKKSKAVKKAPFRLTTVLREKVVRYIGCKMSPTDVARAIRCTLADLEKFFPEELATGYARYRAKVLDSLDEQMEDGTAGATNRLEALTAVPEEPDGAPGARGQGTGYVGKKVAARSAAQGAVNAGGKFAPMAPPRLVVNNGDGK